VIAYLAPTVAVLLGVVALDEHFGVSTVLGMAMIFGGSWMATGKGAGTEIRKQESGSAPGHEPAGSES
jgi:drug/metabolite transporter (DMT)-like permease